MSVRYSIHGVVGVSVQEGKLDLPTGYDHYLRHFRGGDMKRDGFQYEVFEYKELDPPAPLREGNGVFGVRSGVCFPREKYACTFDGRKAQEYVSYPAPAGNFWVQQLLLGNDMSFVHAAGISWKGKTFLFPAFGGAGKTTLVGAMRNEEGFMFFGDDHVIIDKKGVLHSYPSDFSIYSCHLATFPELHGTHWHRYLLRRKILAPFYGVKRAANFLIKRVTGRGNAFFGGPTAEYAKVPVSVLIPSEKIGTRAKISACIFLNRSRQGGIAKIEKEKAVREIIGILNLELRGGWRYINTLGAFGFADSVSFLERQKAVIRECLEHIPCYRLSVPEGLRAGEYPRFLEEQFQVLEEK